MKELKIFYLESCPYCRKAMDAVQELKRESSDYEKVNIKWIEETIHPEIADNYDYYRVPSIFFGEEKLYECSPRDDYKEIKQQVGNALKIAKG